MFKGVWYSSSGKNVDVAVKTLNEGSDEQDRVKFLQEAAIMGQFRHPNVVTMHGVVTEGEPVSVYVRRNHMFCFMISCTHTRTGFISSGIAD